MYLHDLTVLPPDHPPSPFPFPPPIKKGEVWGSGWLRKGLKLVAVGWLGRRVPTTGETPPKVLKRLFWAHKNNRWINDGTAGWHDCELCSGPDEWYPDGQVGPLVRWGLTRRRVRGYGHFLVRQYETVYMAPVLILHYIVDHGYRPPDVFLEALEKGELLSPDDLFWVPPETD